MEGFTEELAACLEQMRLKGFVLPLTFTSIAANHVIFAGRYIGEWNALETEFLRESTDPLRLPIYFLFVDARGEAAGFILVPHDSYFVQWPSVPRSTQGH